MVRTMKIAGDCRGDGLGDQPADGEAEDALDLPATDDELRREGEEVLGDAVIAEREPDLAGVGHAQPVPEAEQAGEHGAEAEEPEHPGEGVVVTVVNDVAQRTRERGRVLSGGGEERALEQAAQRDGGAACGAPVGRIPLVCCTGFRPRVDLLVKKLSTRA